jgi:thioredoxin reductase (NADPH)
MEHTLYDAVVVGGGPAGLMAAIYLARFRRSVALLDAGHSRVARIPRSHNYPGLADGVSGLAVRDMLREQVSRYAVSAMAGFVEDVERHEQGFGLRTAAGLVSGRLLLLATGVTDIPPAMPHIREALDAGALRYCPVCDAYEVAGRTVGVYTQSQAGIAEALYLRHFTADVTLFLAAGAQALTAQERARLKGAGVRWTDAPVEAVRLEQGRVAVVQAHGTRWCDTLYAALGVTVHSQLAGSLGAVLDAVGYVETDAHHATSVPGLYAAGDVCKGLNQIAVALGGAAIAASAMHQALPPDWQRAA